ncbi:MAG: hypothetical protein ABSC64_14115 [Candidatus Korobacteraceae bacterium]|jgi:hypothetical protein
MKPKLALEMRPADTQEMQLICNCCGQPYYPNKAWEDRIRAIIFGAEDYAVCPLCTQAVPDDILHDEGYRQRCRYKVERLRELFEAENAAHSQRRRSTSEPTYEELKARLAELEAKQQRGLTFKVSDKGGVSVYGLGRFPVTLYYEQWVRLLDMSKELREFIEQNKSNLKMKDQ